MEIHVFKLQDGKLIFLIVGLANPEDIVAIQEVAAKTKSEDVGAITLGFPASTTVHVHFNEGGTK